MVRGWGRGEGRGGEGRGGEGRGGEGRGGEGRGGEGRGGEGRGGEGREGGEGRGTSIEQSTLSKTNAESSNDIGDHIRSITFGTGLLWGTGAAAVDGVILLILLFRSRACDSASFALVVIFFRSESSPFKATSFVFSWCRKVWSSSSSCFLSCFTLSTSLSAFFARSWSS